MYDKNFKHITGEFKMMKSSTLYAFFFISTVVCTLARVFSVLYVTDSATGFFYSRQNTIGVFLTVLVFLLAVLLFIFASL